ncbi:hypothetical protein HD806DRAFT_521232 [Xylariaceae sp. AK1471]|nr:hypothetical protein HD806DRAFT_521232 [Xylariaceae sp. AK1471]
MSVPPPEFLPVLLGNGSFLRDTDGNLRFDANGHLLYLISTADAFLHVKPSIQSQQFWPEETAPNLPKNTSIVLLTVAVNTDCKDENIITEIGYTIYDTAAIYIGEKINRKPKIPGCMAPGPRGENITKLALSRHFIVRDTADHHPGTCNWPAHIAQPYHFSYRKSEFIDRGHISSMLEDTYNNAARRGLSNEAIEKGDRRAVVIVSWGDDSIDPQIKATSWYINNQFFQHWDIRKHPLIRTCFLTPNPTYISCLDLFGIQHRAHGREIGHNAGNCSAFTIQLLLGLCFLTEEQRTLVRQKVNLTPSSRFPGVESVVARNNRPPGSGPLPPGRVPILH